MEGHIIAGRYARALFDVVPAEQWDQAYDEITAVSDFFRNNPDALKLIVSPLISGAVKDTVFRKIVQPGDFLRDVESFLDVLYRKDRLILIAHICDAFYALVQDARNMSTAQITTAFAITDEEKNKIVDKLSALTQCELSCMVQENKDLLGGFVAKVGNVIYDFSLKNKIKQLQLTMGCIE